MKKRDIYITDFDLKRLKTLVFEERSSGHDKDYLRNLEEELDRAKVVDAADIPSEVITMNSRVRLKDLATEDEIVLSLAFPQDADIDEGRISVLAPIGTGMIGCKVGDVIEWDVPAGVRKLEIIEILYQPEAEGDFHL
ncbi:MAG: nucleoside diphosphate kinase regulator [Actinomycetota bacterium]